MADEIMNVSKGRFNEFHERVNDNDPANSALIVVILESAEVDATLRDYDDLSTLLGAAGNTEAAFTNYARKTLTDTDVTASTIDDTNDRREADIPDQTWSSAGGATNETVEKLLICYDSDTTGGTDANIIPVAHYDFDVTTNGGDITAQINGSGYGRAA